MSNTSNGARASVSDSGGQPLPVAPLMKKGRIRRAWDATKSFAFAAMGWFSTAGTAAMIAYQCLYPWGYWLPWGWDSSSAWVGGLVMVLVYIVSKMPHLWGQEPGDWPGLIREVFYCIVNVVLATVFFTAVYHGLHYPANAFGIAVTHVIVFLLMIGWQIQAAMRLTMRTWSDQSSGV